MLKKIKKWYFKIYHLFKFLGIIAIVISTKNVYAIEYNSCFDTYKIGNYTFGTSSGYWTTLEPLVPVLNNTTYYIRLFTGTENFTTQNGNVFSVTPRGYNSSQTRLDYVYLENYSFDSENQIFTFKVPSTPTNLAYIQLQVYLWNTNYNVLENTPVVISTNREDLLTCSTTPEEPEPENNVYTEFLTIYLNKITYLAEGFTNNPYLITMIGIIISWVILELLFKILHLRGGKRK